MKKVTVGLALVLTVCLVFVFTNAGAQTVGGNTGNNAGNNSGNTGNMSNNMGQTVIWGSKGADQATWATIWVKRVIIWEAAVIAREAAWDLEWVARWAVEWAAARAVVAVQAVAQEVVRAVVAVLVVVLEVVATADNVFFQ